MAYAPTEIRRSTGTSRGQDAPGQRVPKAGRPMALPASAPTRRTRGSFLAGLGIGLVVGAAVALVLAPQSGADTRRALRRRGRRIRNRAADTWEDLRLELDRTKRALRRRRRETAAAADDGPDGDD
jgi:hypothetical protein